MDVTFLHSLPQNVALTCDKIPVLAAGWAGLTLRRELGALSPVPCSPAAEEPFCNKSRAEGS